MNKSCDDSSNKFWGRKRLFTSSFLCGEFSLISSGISISLRIFLESTPGLSSQGIDYKTNSQKVCNCFKYFKVMFLLKQRS